MAFVLMQIDGVKKKKQVNKKQKKKKQIEKKSIINKAHTHPPDTHEVEVNKCLARMKHKAATTSTNPIEIYCDWALTNDGLRLLLKDSIENQFEDRVIIFATDEGLKHITEAETSIFDGNLALAPSIFQQLYVIRVKIHGLYITTGIIRPIGISRPGKKTKFRNIPPIFPPATWNVTETSIKN
ncbi:Uncharacterized protein FWK35_00014217 [Aphis craccivora]|uniref:Uncharacterized protein n=1 Tax=Aphis craccivora TaxID=307492 RepID=A0A6G0Y8J7_APHCR|nr:Uncharacterized protein FWK35_00014217 [Aphis craccivora]